MSLRAGNPRGFKLFRMMSRISTSVCRLHSRRIVSSSSEFSSANVYKIISTQLPSGFSILFTNIQHNTFKTKILCRQDTKKVQQHFLNAELYTGWHPYKILFGLIHMPDNITVACI
jgi:hypothetical protein